MRLWRSTGRFIKHRTNGLFDKRHGTGGIEACLGSLLSCGDKVLVPRFGRFGYLLTEIAQRVGGDVITLDTEWGTVFETARICDAIYKHRPRVVALVPNDTSTTMAQPLDGISAVCREVDALLYVDTTATLCGMPIPVDDLQLDAVSTGLQKCMSGPPGTSPITINERAAAVVNNRKHIEGGIRPDDYVAGDGPKIISNYLDLGMLMDYWSPKRLNHHTVHLHALCRKGMCTCDFGRRTGCWVYPSRNG